ncbi:MAG: hypothetical protein WD823_07960 [Sulfuricaulis sp.]|uniref:hypothetical protein n=1 Tax=Sulfuricaulis sp. TaxID=2003553 RepID=UPI0034A48D24
MQRSTRTERDRRFTPRERDLIAPRVVIVHPHDELAGATPRDRCPPGLGGKAWPATGTKHHRLHDWSASAIEGSVDDLILYAVPGKAHSVAGVPARRCRARIGGVTLDARGKRSVVRSREAGSTLQRLE